MNVTLYDTVAGKKQADVELSALLTTDRYKHRVEVLRANIGNKDFDKQQYKRMNLPAYTVGGTFKVGGHSLGNLNEPTSLVCLDFDNLTTEQLNALKERLKRWAYTYYAGLSCSGKGLFAVVKVANYEEHLGHWLSLEEMFKRHGYELDRQTKDLNRMRFVSYDADGYLNEDSAVYTAVKEQPKHTHNQATIYPTNNSNDRLTQLIQAIITSGRDITANTTEWIKIGAVVKGCFADAGRTYFHQLSQYYPRYNERNTNRLFDRITTGQPEAVLFAIAKQHGITLNQ